MTIVNPRVSKLAEIIVNYSADVQAGQRVLIRFGFLAQPLLYEVYRLCLEAGAAEVVFQPGLGEDDLLELFFKHSNKKQRNTLPKLMEYMTQNVDAFIILDAPRNTRFLSSIDPDVQTEYYTTLRPITDWRVDNTHWTLAQYPTEALAMDAGMSLTDYADFLFAACNEVDWAAKKKEQQNLVKAIDNTKTVRIVGPDTDLKMSIEGRKAEDASGENNMPDGEVFTSVVEDSTEGHIYYSFPCILYGIAVNDVRLKFEKGKVVEATSSNNQEQLNKFLDTDEGARRIGELGIGNNFAIKQFSSNILFDEKIGGTIHLALGNGYTETLSKNESAIHWDMVKDLRTEGELYFDDKLVQKNGEWLIKLK
jgi:aminopeptidase